MQWSLRMMHSIHNSASRRGFIRLAGLVAAGAAVSACEPVYTRVSTALRLNQTAELGKDFIDPAQFPLLNRLTFGPRVEDLVFAARAGVDGWIEEQLAPEGIDDFALELLLRRYPTLHMDSDQLADLSDQIFDNVDRQSVPHELQRATLIRQVSSRRQLLELMVDFWSDHFNISVEKGDCFFLKTVDDREVIRRHALGNFRDLLWASAHSPAMLVYLDNQSNHKGAPNENYARELLELHTLGVGNGYTQKDVMELARCLTGWTVKEHFWRGRFTFKDDLHDAQPKTVLGLVIPPGGQSEAEAVIDHLASHPDTARFIARKLARRFIANDPPAELVERTAQVFLQTSGDIQAVLRSLLLNGLALMQPKFKRPSHFIASALRQLDVQTDAGDAVQAFLGLMGQPYFCWPTPDGYPERDEAWKNNLVPRWQFAIALAQNQIPGTQIDLPRLVENREARSTSDLLDRLSSLLLGTPLSGEPRTALVEAFAQAGVGKEETAAAIAAGLLASPAFQYR
jgi:hypothetical protein